MICPKCKSTLRKNGFNLNDTQRYNCYICKKNITFSDKRKIYSKEYKIEIVKKYKESGKSSRAFSKTITISHVTLSNWVMLYWNETTNERQNDSNSGDWS